MTKTIETLQKDVNHVLKTGEGWTKEVSEWVARDIYKSLQRQLTNRSTDDRKTLRLSSLGKPCERQLWYTFHSKRGQEPLPANVYSKFLFGDMIESYLIGLAMASGHHVTGMQDQLDVYGIKGHRDCVIDGVTVDTKSASTISFNKFKGGLKKEDDAFGYISQLSSYVHGGKKDPKVTDKTRGAFFVMDKTLGHVWVDIHDFTWEIEEKEQEVKRKKAIVEDPSTTPDRIEGGEAPQYVKNGQPTNGNVKLVAPCSYCGFKHECYPGLRSFAYSNSVQHLTKVEKEPQGKVVELT